MISLKEGVDLTRIDNHIWAAVWVVADVADGLEPGIEIVVTAGRDGRHKTGSLHYKGRAVDIRTWNLKNPAKVRDLVAFRLGKDYDVLFENPGQEDQHLHVEWDPK